jgi:hypothetical protein
MLPGLTVVCCTVVGGCVSWVPGTIVDVSVIDLIEALSTQDCGIRLEGLLFGLVVVQYCYMS